MTVSLPKTPAKAIFAFESFALDPNNDQWSFYIESRRSYRGPTADPIAKARRALIRQQERPQSDRQFTKILLSGHKGTGKSTELHYLQIALSSTYEVIPISLTQHLNFDDVDARDVFYVLAGQVVERLKRLEGLARLERDPSTRAVLAWLRRGLPAHLEENALDISLFGMFSGRLRFDRGLRQDLRRIAEGQPDDLLQLINRPIQLLEELVQRPLLLLVDDLDRLGPQVPGRDQLFSRDFPLLTRPNAAIVYTIPIELSIDERFTIVHNHRPKLMISHVKLWMDHQQAQRYEPGWEVMRQFVHSRAQPSLFPVEVLDRAIALSGGSFDLLRRLLYHALDLADLQHQDSISQDDLDSAVREERADHQRRFGSLTYIQALHRIHQQKNIEVPGDLVFLPTLAVMEYENDGPWFDVSPLLVDWVEARWRELGGA